MKHDTFESPNRPRPTLLWLTQYLIGEQASRDREITRQWLAKEPERLEAVEHTERAIQYSKEIAASSVMVTVTETQAALEQAMQRVGMRNLPQTRSPLARKILFTHGRLRRAWTIGVTACAVLGAVVVVTFFQLQSHATRGADDTARYVTGRSQHSIVGLPDGSHAVLAPETQVTYTIGPNGTRQVELHGEAIFTVQHDPARPFTVTTRRVTTTVLGTTFAVRSYAEDAYVRVSVTEGKVASGGKGEAVQLTPGMVAILTDSTAQLVESTTGDGHLAWAKGQLVFDDTPVPEMLATLRRWYGYEFRLADTSLAKRYVTASFNINTPEKTLRELQALLSVTITQTDSIITLHPVRRSQNMMIKRQPQHARMTAMEGGR